MLRFSLTPHVQLPNLGFRQKNTSSARAGKHLEQVGKLAIVYATPPLSPPAQQTALDQPLVTLKGRSTGMDHNDRRQRQNNPSGYAGHQGLIHTSPQYPAVSGSSERFRQPQLPVQSPTSAPSTGRSSSIQGYSYPYGSDGAQFAGPQMQTGVLQYQTEYTQESQRSQQGYQQYGTNIAGMYNVPSQQAAAPQSPYESVPPYQPRQSAAIEVLSTQFGVPQQYYVPGEGGPTSAPNTALAAQNVQSQYTTMSYTTQSPVGREPLAPAYPAGMTDPGQSSSQGAYGQANYGQQSAAQTAELDVAYGQYQQELRRTFECVRDGRLAEAGTSLLHVSDWLLGNAESLVRDDENMHSERLKLWEEFNNCWLATLQRQKEMSSDVAEAGQRPPPPQSLIEYDYLETMGKELVRLCDIIEKHGLVDYQMGVWEEEIINLLTQCLDLLEDQGGGPGSANVQRSSSTTQRRR